MNELNTSQIDAGGSFGLEAEHASYPSFDTAMIPLDGAVLVFTGTGGDGLSTLSQPVLSNALHDGRPIGLAAVDSNLLWPALFRQCFAHKAFGSFHVPVSADRNSTGLPLLSMARYR